MSGVVRYGDRVLLKHCATGMLLKSVPKVYSHPNSSKQQIVGGEILQDEFCLWIVKGPDSSGNNYAVGADVKRGDAIRLEHVRTGKNLHSHSAPAPLNPLQHEVTAYGAVGNGDANDDWVVDLANHGAWNYGDKMCLSWSSTSYVLHSHKGYAHPLYTDGLQEVTANPKADENDYWTCIPISPRGAAAKVQGPTRLDWVSVLSIVGSVASITGWTLLSLKGALQQTGFVYLTALVLTIVMIAGALILLSGVALGLYRQLTFNPKSGWSKVGFLLMFWGANLIVVLSAWKLGQYVMIWSSWFVKWSITAP